MIWRVIIWPNAEADLREARARYESQRVGLGDELLIEIRAAIHRLETNPERRPFYYLVIFAACERAGFLTNCSMASKAAASSSSAFCTRNGSTGGGFELEWRTRSKFDFPPRAFGFG